MARRLIVFDCNTVRVLDPSQLSELDKEGPRDLFVVMIEGDVIASGRLSVFKQMEGGAAHAGGGSDIAVVLDQMFKGYYPDVIEREEPGVEVHVIVGRGL